MRKYTQTLLTIIMFGIVLATGTRPNNALSQSLKGKVPELYQAGDCIEPRRFLEAIHEGADAALRI